jgi:hypothetical protein
MVLIVVKCVGRDFIGEKSMQVGFGRLLMVAVKPDGIFDVGGEVLECQVIRGFQYYVNTLF